MIVYKGRIGKLYFIPLEYVEKCELQYDHKETKYIEPTYTTKKKSPVKRAIVGGVLAGPTGAIVGAVSGMGEGEKVMTSPGRSNCYELYSLVIKLHNKRNEYQEDHFDILRGTQDKEIINQMNMNSRQLICTAKSTKDVETKKKIVEASLKTGKEEIEKETKEKEREANEKEKENQLKLFIVIIPIIIFFVLLMININLNS